MATIENIQTPKAQIEYNCGGCEKLHTVIVESIDGMAGNYVVAVQEMLILSGVTKFRVYDVSQIGEKVDITAAIVKLGIDKVMADIGL